MKNLKNLYKELSDTEKQKIITKLYVKKQKSFDDIAQMYDTYPNKIRRDAKKFNIPIRSRSEAQKNALDSGRTRHPTKGTIRSQQTKEKIGMSLLKSWESMSDSKLQSIREKQRKIQQEIELIKGMIKRNDKAITLQLCVGK